MAKKRHSKPASRQSKKKKLSDIPEEDDKLPKSKVKDSSSALLIISSDSPQEPTSNPVRNIINLDNSSFAPVITSSEDFLMLADHSCSI
jgi:hypothetical protein